MHRTIPALAATVALALATAAHAQVTQTNPACNPAATSCTSSNQQQGDVSTVNNNGDSHATSAANGNSNSSNSNQSGNSIAPEFDNKAQTTQNATNTTTGTISGGNTSSGASSIGNSSSNDNHSSVGNTSASTGASNANGTNTMGAMTTGASSSGGNTMTGGANTAQGGAGGVGGAGGAGGSASNLGINGQQQGIAGSGNSHSSNSLRGGDQSNSQGQGQSSVNKLGQSSVLAGGNQDASTRSGVGQSGNSTTSVDTSDRSSHSYTDNSRVQFIPAVVPVTPPTSVPASSVATLVTACHGASRVEREAITGQYVGFFHSRAIDLGQTDRIVPDTSRPYYSEQKLPDGSVKLWGTQEVIQTAVISVSGGRNIALGGGSGSGQWGQAGGGSSSAMQRMVTSVQQVPCEIGTLAAPAPAPTVIVRSIRQ